MPFHVHNTVRQDILAVYENRKTSSLTIQEIHDLIPGYRWSRKKLYAIAQIMCNEKLLDRLDRPEDIVYKLPDVNNDIESNSLEPFQPLSLTGADILVDILRDPDYQSSDLPVISEMRQYLNGIQIAVLTMVDFPSMNFENISVWIGMYVSYIQLGILDGFRSHGIEIPNSQYISIKEELDARIKKSQ